MEQITESQPSMAVANDYSCTITINNKTSVDFGLNGFHASWGYFPQEQPVNTCEADQTVQVVIKDKSGPAGSEGWVEYSLTLEKHPDVNVTFRLNFADPYGGWNENYLRGSTNHPELLSVQIHNYNSTGHPFFAEASIYAVGSKSINAQHDGQPCTKLPSPSVGAKFSIGFKPEGWTWFPIGTDPVHENIAIAAFIKANKMLPVATTYENLSKKQWEYFRGLLWNDDPSGLLFDDVTDDNRNFSDGVDFGKAFKLGSPGTMTQRSHFGDLQCLHGMAAKHGEAPETTRFNILVWMEAMYKLACGNQDVKAESTLRSALPAYFSSSTQPSGDTTLKQLLMGQRASFKLPNIQFRAIGVCLHMIQDSYAVGHTHRCLKNPQDLDGRDNEGFLRFKPGTYGRWGAVQAFHSYAGQDSSRHKHYDELEGTPSLVPRQLDSFNNVVGARDAIDQSATLLGFYAKKTRWEDGVRAWLEGEVFALAPNARPADGEVDEPTGRPCAAGRLSMSDGGAAPSYDAGLRRKLALVDGERGYDLESSLGTLAWTGHRGRRPLLRRVLMVFLVILALIAGVVASAVLSRVLAVFVRSLA